VISKRSFSTTFHRDTKLLNASTGIIAVSFFGIQILLQVLYLLRLGFGVEYIGLYGATGALAYMLMGIPSGAVSNRFGMRSTILGGGVITILGMAILPLVEFVPLDVRPAVPLISQVVLTVGWSMYSVNMVPAMMAVTTPQDRNQAYAINSVLRGVGTFVGTICGGLLPGFFASLLGQSVDAPEPYRISLWVGAGLGLIALFPLVLIGPLKAVEDTTPDAPDSPFPTLPLILVISYIFLSHGAWASCQAFCSAYMDTELNLSAASIGLITGAGQFVAMLAPLLNPRLAARRSNGWTLMITALGYMVSLLPLALLPHWTAAGLGRLGVMTLSAVWLPAFQVFQMELVTRRWRSLAYGIVSTAMGFTYGTISLVGGYMAANWGYRSLFLLGAGVGLLAAILMWFMIRRSFAPSAMAGVS
jgi:MFS family permease